MKAFRYYKPRECSYERDCFVAILQRSQEVSDLRVRVRILALAGRDILGVPYVGQGNHASAISGVFMTRFPKNWYRNCSIFNISNL